jgi:hypothetical protein
MPPRRQQKGGHDDDSRTTQIYQFINLSDHLEIKEQDKDLIRSQAITDSHRRRRANNPTASIEGGSAPSRPLAPLRINRFRLQRPQPSSTTPNDNGRPLLNPVSETTTFVPEEEHVLGSTIPPAAIDSVVDIDGITRQSSHSPSRAIDSLDRRLDLLAGEIEPLLSLPVNSPDKLRRFVHHYCKRELSTGDKT